MSKLREIGEGWTNLLLKKSTPESERRYAICKACIEASKLGICKKCGCYIPAKVQSPRSVCPLKKWIL